MLIQNAKAFMDGKFQEKTDLLIRDGRISAIGTGLAAEGEETLDLGGDLLLPGFVDVHIHAFKGMDTMQGEEAVRHMSRELKKVGVAAFLPTTMSASPEDTVKALEGIKAVMDRPEPVQQVFAKDRKLAAEILLCRQRLARRRTFASK